ncbi:MAG: CDP-diacylglycerol--glycerol-3-phosphate 3-phosphatidyltransferase [Bryobacterales bacterium]|nr:CDP-diacylglycerol--glycerol-3-phosphate 3-phosphatidyltransferase [Bryobacterales bacterium]
MPAPKTNSPPVPEDQVSLSTAGAAQAIDRRAQIPNLLTILRIFFVPLLVALLVQKSWGVTVWGRQVSNEAIALAVFLVAGFTDLLDGYLARRWQKITTVGMLLDPIADKLLISAALIALVQVQVVPAWMVIVVLGREFAVTGLRSIAAAEGFTIQASELGKWKMVSQILAVVLLILSIHNQWLRVPALAVMWCMVGFALVAGTQYFLRFWSQLDQSVKSRRRRELLALETDKQRRKVSLARVARQRNKAAGKPFRWNALRAWERAARRQESQSTASHPRPPAGT